MSGFKTIGPVIRAMLSKGQYHDRIRFRILFDIEAKEYELVGLPDWPAYKEALERGEYRLVIGMTGEEVRQAYVEFNKVQGRLFDEPSNPAGMETGKQSGDNSTGVHVSASGDSGSEPGKDNVDGGTGHDDRAAESGGESEAG